MTKVDHPSELRPFETGFWTSETFDGEVVESDVDVPCFLIGRTFQKPLRARTDATLPRYIRAASHATKDQNRDISLKYSISPSKVITPPIKPPPSITLDFEATPLDV